MSRHRMDADTAETGVGVIRLLRRAAELVWAVVDAGKTTSLGSIPAPSGPNRRRHSSATAWSASALQLEAFWVLTLSDGSKVEVFGPDSASNRHFTTGPGAGFLVDDVFGATEELRSAGVEVLLEPELDTRGKAWVHFRARRATSTYSPRTRESLDRVTVPKGDGKAVRQQVPPQKFDRDC